MKRLVLYAAMLLAGLSLTACGGGAGRAGITGLPPDDSHIPPFARVPYQAFSREAAVQIALREWRAFGQPIVVGDQELPFDNERAEGLWQRVGEYWWLGLPLGMSEQAWTGIHDQNGQIFSTSVDGNYAWSAAFISYVMRMSGAGHRFPYSPSHSEYINAARQGGSGYAIAAERPETYAPQRGDLICLSRGRQRLRFDDLPTSSHFPGHCDIVVANRAGSLDVIGGNVANSVSMKHVPVTADGRLATPDGTVLDRDFPWFVVIRVNYDINGSGSPAPTS